MTDPLNSGLAELFYAAGGCAEKGDLDGLQVVLEAIKPMLAHVKKLVEPPKKFSVRMVSYGSRKIDVIKALRKFYNETLKTHLGLKEAKEQVEATGQLLTEGAIGTRPLVLKESVAIELGHVLRYAGAEYACEPAP